VNVLIVSNALPYPPHDGSRLILFNLLKNFSPSTCIDLIALVDASHSTRHAEMVTRFCDSLTTVPATNRNRMIDKFVSNLSIDPYSVVWRYSSQMALHLRHKLTQKKYDVINLFGVSSSLYGLPIRDVPKLAYEIDAGSLYFRRNFFREKVVYKKLFYLIEYQKMKRYERKVYPKFDRCVVVSQVDKTAILRVCPSAKIDVIPNGIDTDYFRPSHKEQFPLILFSGNMDYPPNIHAVLWFYHNVFSAISKEFPDVRLCLVGRNPSRQFDPLRKDHRVIITGFVKDIRRWFDKASVYVCPMISGVGTKNKMLEAMAMEKALVTTSLTMGSVPGVADCVLRADSPSEFSDAILMLLKDNCLRKELGKRGRRFVLKYNNWKNSAERLEQIYFDITNNFQGK